MDDKFVIRGLTASEKEVIRTALSIFANEDGGWKQMRKQAKSMLEQEMVENFLWKTGRES